ncbi:MAG: prepilin-type N-terminal cleavage/methylation domain-containing protein [Burkholderiales bacterium]|nr:prepilin-type N-terminal cleavage/methylation domain-containing protein [Burkholderiales bacterium]
MAPTLRRFAGRFPPGGRIPLGAARRGIAVLTYRHQRGFTLIELLVAVGIMAVMAGLSWRGIDGMVQTQAHVQQRSDALLTLQAGLAQWAADLDAMADGPMEQTMDWDSRSLRLLRRNAAAPGDGMLVVAWARRSVGGAGQWLRWQSPPVRTRKEQRAAWARAAAWAQNPGDDEKKYEVRITPLAQWEIFYFRNDAWSHPLSSGDAASAAASAPTATTATTSAAVVAATVASQTRPDGVRVVLTLPPGEALSGTLTRDWIRPTLGGGKS